jgi:glycosyltransferase involved in cell wall biosynthesis
MSPAGFTTNNVGEIGMFFRACFNRLRRDGRSARFLTHTEALAEQFSLAAREEVRGAPLHLPCAPRGLQSPGEERKPPQILLYVGDPRDTKGFHLLPEIYQRVRRANPQALLVIHQNPSGANATTSASLELLRKAFATFEELASRDPRSRLIRGYLSPRAYSDVIEGSDLLVLPYNPQAYKNNPAGPAVDALSLGRPLVLPALAESAEHLLHLANPGVTFDEFSAQSIAEAVNRAIADLDELRRRAKAAMPRFRAMHGTDKMVDAILSTAGLVEPARQA